MPLMIGLWNIVCYTGTQYHLLWVQQNMGYMVDVP
jgi:hypothetical protein